MLNVSSSSSASWSEISSTSIRLSWRKTLPEGPATEEASGDESYVAECGSLFQELGHKLHEEGIEEWLEADNNDTGYAHLSDDEIISDITEKSTQEEANHQKTLMQLFRLFHMIQQ